MPRLTPRAAGGFTYLMLLGLLALAGAGLAATGVQWQTQAQREREAELLFRGQQIREALGRYALATPEGQAKAPLQLEALLQDTRHAPPRHHLRQLWADPFTGQADWVLLRDAQGGILGVHSRASTLAFKRHRLPPGVGSGSGGAVPVSAWRFMADTPANIAVPDKTEPPNEAASAPPRLRRTTPREG